MKTPSVSAPVHVAIYVLLFSAAPLRAQNGADFWSALDPRATFDGSVYAILEDDAGQIYVGGSFKHVGDLTVNGIAMWDGSAWHSLGAGLAGNSYALTLAISDGRLYVGGKFQRAGEVNVRDIAMWDGAEWISLGDGIGTLWSIETEVNAIVADRAGGVYVGGKFHTAGGIETYGIAHWDGSAWSGLAGGMSGDLINGDPQDQVMGLAVGEGGKLYAGGRFTTAGNVAANRVAVWDGTVWSSLGSGIEADGQMWGTVVYAIVYSDGNLYASGDFRTAGGVESHNIARWDGSRWLAMDAGLCADIYGVEDLAVFRGNVIASSSVDCGAERTARRTGVMWTGTDWKGMDGGVSNGVISAFAVVGDRLLVGADAAFEAGGTMVSGIAAWTGGASTGMDTGEASMPASLQLKLIDVYPNPFQDRVTFRVVSERAGQLHLLGSDLAGRQVWDRFATVPRGGTIFSWSPAADLPSGPYFLSALLVTVSSSTRAPGVLVTKW